MSKVAETLAEKRHEKAELEHLRVFFMLWCDFHATCATKAHDADKQRCAQLMTEQAHKLKEFYG